MLPVSAFILYILSLKADHPPTIAIDGSDVKVVDDFKYLGSNISSIAIDTEINSRIAKASATS
jgi:hypothetical protein